MCSRDASCSAGRLWPSRTPLVVPALKHTCQRLAEAPGSRKAADRDVRHVSLQSGCQTGRFRAGCCRFLMRFHHAFVAVSVSSSWWEDMTRLLEPWKSVLFSKKPCWTGSRRFPGVWRAEMRSTWTRDCIKRVFLANAIVFKLHESLSRDFPLALE